LIKELTPKEIRRRFDYDPATGILLWRIKVNDRAPAGSVAGYPDSRGYLRVRSCGRHYAVHRVIWAYMTGEWPADCIDHINLNKKDNRWANLRECSRSQNGMNTRPQPHNKLGVKNVSPTSAGAYVASVCKEGKHHKKYFPDLDDAKQWAASKRRELHGDFHHD